MSSPRPASTAAARRLMNRDEAAAYLSTCTKTVDRLIALGQLPTVRLPVETRRNGLSRVGVNRRILIDVRDLDILIARSKERA